MLPSSYHLRFYDEPAWRKWFMRLTPRSRALVRRKIERLVEHGIGLGMPLVRQLTGELYELRIDKYPLYFTTGESTIWFLAYGDKDSQQRDIPKAQERIS